MQVIRVDEKPGTITQALIGSLVNDWNQQRLKRQQEEESKRGVKALTDAMGVLKPTATQADVEAAANNVVQGTYGQNVLGADPTQKIITAKSNYDAADQNIQRINSAIGADGVTPDLVNQYNAEKTQWEAKKQQAIQEGQLWRGLAGKVGVDLSGLGADNTLQDSQQVTQAPNYKPIALSLKEIDQDGALQKQAQATAQKAAQEKFYSNFTPSTALVNAYTAMANSGISKETMTALMPLLQAQIKDVSNARIAEIKQQIASTDASTQEGRNKVISLASQIDQLGGAGFDFLKAIRPDIKVDKFTNGAQTGYNYIKTDPVTGNVSVQNGSRENVQLSPEASANINLQKEKFAFDANRYEKDFALKQEQIKRDWKKQDELIRTSNYKDYINGKRLEIQSLDHTATGLITMAKNLMPGDERLKEISAQLEAIDKEKKNIHSGINDILAKEYPQYFSKQQQTDNVNNDPVGQWIRSSYAAGAKKEQIQQKLREKGYGDTYDSWLY